jgi:hypothetical protein
MGVLRGASSRYMFLFIEFWSFSPLASSVFGLSLTQILSRLVCW